jgi:hypothetical protein
MKFQTRTLVPQPGLHPALRAGAWCLALCLAAMGLTLPSCSEDAGSGTTGHGIGALTAPLGAPVQPPPTELVTIGFLGRELTCWPYTGTLFNDTPADPINLVFTGRANPLQLRAALLALDGNRTAFGFPDAYPFNATWSDAIGDVQSNWSENEDWVDNYVQLQLGAYEPVRVHVRFFQTDVPFDGGVWTLGGAHFEVHIPGTADHQVISWEVAEQVVVADLMRSGLLDPTNPMGSSGVINAMPSFRTIPAPIYNGLPDELKMLALGPGFPEHVEDPVPIPSDGTATILNVAVAAPIVPGIFVQSFAFNYEIVMPKPICNPDGNQYVLVTGPVSFEETCGIGTSGRYEARGGYSGALTITPWDPVNNVPVGATYPAEVGNHFEGFAKGGHWRMQASTRQIAHEEGGSEFVMISLDAASEGAEHATLRSKCLSGDQ